MKISIILLILLTLGQVSARREKLAAAHVADLERSTRRATAGVLSLREVLAEMFQRES